jgi:phosphate transport system protein
MEARSLTSYDADLADLQQHLLRLAESVDRAVVGAIWALAHSDSDEARRIVANNTAIERLRYELEESAIQLLALKVRLPYGVRAISAVMFVSAELERIGAYAYGIAALVLRQANLPPRSIPPVIEQMAHKAREMLQSAIRALIRCNTDAAAQLEQTDTVINQLYQQMQREVFLALRENPEDSEWAIYLIWIGHTLERIADRAVNIAGRAAFATGAPLLSHRQPALTIPL